jgi:hypothetical protein
MTGQTVFSAGFGGSWASVANSARQMGSIILVSFEKPLCGD